MISVFNEDRDRFLLDIFNIGVSLGMFGFTAAVAVMGVWVR